MKIARAVLVILSGPETWNWRAFGSLWSGRRAGWRRVVWATFQWLAIAAACWGMWKWSQLGIAERGQVGDSVAPITVLLAAVTVVISVRIAQRERHVEQRRLVHEFLAGVESRLAGYLAALKERVSVSLGFAGSTDLPDRRVTFEIQGKLYVEQQRAKLMGLGTLAGLFRHPIAYLSAAFPALVSTERNRAYALAQDDMSAAACLFRATIAASGNDPLDPRTAAVAGNRLVAGALAALSNTYASLFFIATGDLPHLLGELMIDGELGAAQFATERAAYCREFDDLVEIGRGLGTRPQ